MISGGYLHKDQLGECFEVPFFNFDDIVLLLLPLIIIVTL